MRVRGRCLFLCFFSHFSYSDTAIVLRDLKCPKYLKTIKRNSFLQVATFFIFLLPFRVLVLWTMYASGEDYDLLGPAGWYPLLYFARIMFYLNSASNPIVLYAMSSKFRTKFQHILCCRPLPISSQVSRSGTLRYSVRAEYSSSFPRPEFDTKSANYSFKCKNAFSNGNDNGNGNHTFHPIEESPML
jgi:hypothetical protein